MRVWLIQMKGWRLQKTVGPIEVRGMVASWLIYEDDYEVEGLTIGNDSLAYTSDGGANANGALATSA